MPLGREAVEQLRHGLVVVDISGKILYVNPSFLISTGQPDGSLLLGKDIENVLHMDLHLQDLLEKDGAYLPSIQENTLTREDGSQVFYLMHWGLVRSPAGFPLYIFGVMLYLSGR